MPSRARCLLAAILALAVAAVLAGCDDRPVPAPSSGAAPSRGAPVEPTTTRGAEDELLAAYDRSWEVYADALRRLDPSRLPSVFAGNALRAAREEVATQKAKNQPVRVSVVHRPRVLRVTATDGLVEDNYRNHSVVLNPATGAPAEPDPNEVVHQRQSLKRLDGVWKVVEIIEEQRP